MADSSPINKKQVSKTPHKQVQTSNLHSFAIVCYMLNIIKCFRFAMNPNYIIFACSIIYKSFSVKEENEKLRRL